MRREDQDKINRFSRLHQREKVLEEELKAKQVRHQHRVFWASMRLTVRRDVAEGQGRPRGSVDGTGARGRGGQGAVRAALSLCSVETTFQAGSSLVT